METVTLNPENWVHDEVTIQRTKWTFTLWGERYRLRPVRGGWFIVWQERMGKDIVLGSVMDTADGGRKTVHPDYRYYAYDSEADGGALNETGCRYGSDPVLAAVKYVAFRG